MKKGPGKGPFVAAPPRSYLRKFTSDICDSIAVTW